MTNPAEQTEPEETQALTSEFEPPVVEINPDPTLLQTIERSDTSEWTR